MKKITIVLHLICVASMFEHCLLAPGALAAPSDEPDKLEESS